MIGDNKIDLCRELIDKGIKRGHIVYISESLTDKVGTSEDSGQLISDINFFNTNGELNVIGNRLLDIMWVEDGQIIDAFCVVFSDNLEVFKTQIKKFSFEPPKFLEFDINILFPCDLASEVSETVTVFSDSSGEVDINMINLPTFRSDPDIV